MRHLLKLGFRIQLMVTPPAVESNLKKTPRNYSTTPPIQAKFIAVN